MKLCYMADNDNETTVCGPILVRRHNNLSTICFHIKKVHVHNEVYLVVVPRRGV